MGEYDRLYDAFRLPPKQSEEKASMQPLRQKQKVSPDEGMYYEIEYDSTPMPGVGKFVLKTQKIEEPEKDEIRELFNQMRDIARNSRLPFYDSSKFYKDKVRQENSEVFYKQGMFMKDFEDDYEEGAEYKQYFPSYQMMGYRQLRTYFTWRAGVRRGNVEQTSLSYAYLYLYELLNNIGVSDPQDGLDKILFFWDQFRVFEPAIDKYIFRWLKDYHIYYELPWTFREFIEEKGLTEHYPELAGTEDRFDLFCSISKYDIRKSVFFTKDRETLIRDCFQYTLDKLGAVFSEYGFELENEIFFPTKSLTGWVPFRDALFYPWMRQRDRKVTLSSKEAYVCSEGRWFYQTALTTETGRQLAGYILKQMESVLRQTVNYKYKITAGTGMLHPVFLMKLESAGIALEQSVTDAVKEFYREATKTVVTVDKGALAKIRREALETQEKLLVPEEPTPDLQEPLLHDFMVKTEPQHEDVKPEMTKVSEIGLQEIDESQESMKEAIFTTVPSSAHIHEMQEQPSPWKDLKSALMQIEQAALQLILQGDADIRQFADANGIMPEVLADGINEKAVDTVGDSLLDDEFNIYDDYLEQVKEMFS